MNANGKKEIKYAQFNSSSSQKKLKEELNSR